MLHVTGYSWLNHAPMNVDMIPVNGFLGPEEIFPLQVLKADLKLPSLVLLGWHELSHQMFHPGIF